MIQVSLENFRQDTFVLALVHVHIVSLNQWEKLKFDSLHNYWM